MLPKTVSQKKRALPPVDFREGADESPHIVGPDGRYLGNLNSNPATCSAESTTLAKVTVRS